MTPLFPGFLTAWRTLTILRLPGRDAARFAAALPFFPVVGALLGAGVAAVSWAAAAAHWPALAGPAAAGLLALVTGALHLDGLADGADALYGHRTPARRLEIMKDPRVGAMGVTALIFAVLLKVVAIGRLAGDGAWLWLVLPCVWSRAAMPVLAVSLPSARPDGTAGRFLADARPSHAVVAVLLALALTVAVAPRAALACAAATVVLVLLLRRVFRRAVGGVTGDLLGFGSEFIEVALLLGLALAGGASW